MRTDEDEMIELSPERAVTRLGTLIMTAVGGVLAMLTVGSTGIVGPALTALLSILGGICALVVSVLYGRYIGVLGAGGDPEGSGERRAYDALRASLSHGSAPVRLYADTLKALLDAVDDFLGDAKMSERTLFPHAFGLKTPAPLWTAPAFDRCLLLAFIYPLATILVIWVASGHVGPAEEALQLARDVSGWLRILTAATLLFTTYAFCRSWRVDGWKRLVWIALGYASGVALAAANNSPLAGVIGVAMAGGVAAGVSGTEPPLFR